MGLACLALADKGISWSSRTVILEQVASPYRYFMILFVLSIAKLVDYNSGHERQYTVHKKHGLPSLH
jgi:hypothetical protein